MQISPQTKLQIIEGAEVVLPTGKPKKAKIVVADQKIVGVYNELPKQFDQFEKTVFKAPEGSLITPGLIDQHNHGGYGVSFDSDSTDKMLTLMKKLPSLGITRVLPTIMTNPLPQMKNAVSQVEQLAKITNAPDSPETSQVLGIHLEGPCLSVEKKAAHDQKSIEEANKNPRQVLKEIISPLTKLITIAPENVPSDLIQELTQKGIRVSMAHSMATAKQTLEAIKNGVTGLTHIFNTMLPISHRKEYGDPGPIPVFSILPKKHVYAELISDGEHVAPWVIQLLLNVKNMAKKLILVSDSCPLAGGEQGAKGIFSGEALSIKGNKAINDKGILSGSTQFITDGVRNFVNWSKNSNQDSDNHFIAGFKVPIEKIFKMASENPADFLGYGNQLGKIKTGYLADLVLWNKKNLDVMATWVNGKLVYQNKPLNS